jgi:hypothetical protein
MAEALKVLLLLLPFLLLLSRPVGVTQSPALVV